MFSLPRNDRVSVVMTNLEAIAPRVPERWELIGDDHEPGWEPNAHLVSDLRLTVMASSPEIDSSRSMTVRESVLLP